MIRVSCIRIKNFSKIIELILTKEVGTKNLVIFVNSITLFSSIPISNALHLNMDILLQCLNYLKSFLLHRFFYILYERWSESGESTLTDFSSSHILRLSISFSTRLNMTSSFYEKDGCCFSFFWIDSTEVDRYCYQTTIMKYHEASRAVLQPLRSYDPIQNRVMNFNRQQAHSIGLGMIQDGCCVSIKKKVLKIN